MCTRLMQMLAARCDILPSGDLDVCYLLYAFKNGCVCEEMLYFFVLLRDLMLL